MEAIDQTLIERYLANEMTATERTNFEQRLALESGLQQEMEEYKLVMDAIKLAERQELLQRFRERDKILDKKNGIHFINHNRRFWMLSAAAVLMMIIAWRFFIQPTRNSDQAQIVPKDSTTIQQPLPIQKDTIKGDESKKERKEEIMAINEKPKKGTELFADNFEAYTDESMNPTSRSDEEELSAFEQFRLSYWKKNYNEALAAFQKLSPAYQENPNLRFMRANALMALSQIDEATLILNEVSKNPKSKYKTEALYYLALCEVRKGQFDSARKKLTDYLGDPDAVHKAKAKTLLAEMK